MPVNDPPQPICVSCRAALAWAADEDKKLRQRVDDLELQISAARDLVLTTLLEGSPSLERTQAVARALVRGLLR